MAVGKLLTEVTVGSIVKSSLTCGCQICSTLNSTGDPTIYGFVHEPSLTFEDIASPLFCSWKLLWPNVLIDTTWTGDSTFRGNRMPIPIIKRNSSMNVGFGPIQYWKETLKWEWVNTSVHSIAGLSEAVASLALVQNGCSTDGTTFATTRHIRKSI